MFKPMFCFCIHEASCQARSKSEQSRDKLTRLYFTLSLYCVFIIFKLKIRSEYGDCLDDIRIHYLELVNCMNFNHMIDRAEAKGFTHRRCKKINFS